MPNEKLIVGLKPFNFFSRNPGLDVAPSTQDKNKSVLYTGEDKEAPACYNSRL